MELRTFKSGRQWKQCKYHPRLYMIHHVYRVLQSCTIHKRGILLVVNIKWKHCLSFPSPGFQNKHFSIYIPISFFCNTSCAKVHRRPLRNDADKTRRNPVMWNCVDWYVNKNNPTAMKSTTNISEHF